MISGECNLVICAVLSRLNYCNRFSHCCAIVVEGRGKKSDKVVRGQKTDNFSDLLILYFSDAFQ